MKNMDEHTLPIVQVRVRVLLFSTEDEVKGFVDYASGNMMQSVARLHIPVIVASGPYTYNHKSL